MLSIFSFMVSFMFARSVTILMVTIREYTILSGPKRMRIMGGLFSLKRKCKIERKGKGHAS